MSRADRAREASRGPAGRPRGTGPRFHAARTRARARGARADAPQGTRGLVWEASSAHAPSERKQGGRKRPLRRRNEAVRLCGAIRIACLKRPPVAP